MHTHRWPPLGKTVRAPLPYHWRPTPLPPVNQATLQRVIAGLERLSHEHQRRTRTT